MRALRSIRHSWLAARWGIGRAIHWAIAHALGYCWIQCIPCRTMYGGHELCATIRAGAVVISFIGDCSVGRSVCPRCTRRRFKEMRKRAGIPADARISMSEDALRKAIFIPLSGHVTGTPLEGFFPQGMPPQRLLEYKNYKFWKRYSYAHTAVVMTFAAIGFFLPGNFWVPVGMGVGFLMATIATWMAPPQPLDPWSNALALLLPLMFFLVMVVAAIARWPGVTP